MKSISRWMMALLLCLGAALCRGAYADNLSECFLDMDQADFPTLQFEAPFMAPMAYSTRVEHRTFHGFFIRIAQLPSWLYGRMMGRR